MSAIDPKSPAATTITPGLRLDDPLVSYWVAQVTLRLRREVSWCWHQRADRVDPGNGVLPPVADAAAENLDHVRYENEKRHFLTTDVTARYLSDQIAQLQPASPAAKVRGSWSWLVEVLTLDKASQFVLALALAGYLDAGLAAVFATCMNDLSRPFPTLALAQRLWDEPLAIVACADPTHPLFRYGLVAAPTGGGHGIDWQQALELHSVVAQTLLAPAGPLPGGLHCLQLREPRQLDAAGAILAARVKADVAGVMQVVPLLGPKGTDYAAWAGTLAQHTDRELLHVSDDYPIERSSLSALASLAWLRGFDMLMPPAWLQSLSERGAEQLAKVWAVPLRWYVPATDWNHFKSFPAHTLVPPLQIPGLRFDQRVAQFTQGLGADAGDMTGMIEECARRFRFQEQSIARVVETVQATGSLNARTLLAACRNEAVSELGNLAQLVTPRFGADDLVLPGPQLRQVKEIMHAMRTLTKVHYDWGTARVWNESGLSVLFCGPSGTGKTMGAEVLSKELDLPMYRIDLSQVVNKYIGETEKNLKHIFDAAELSDCILFFDEADALFGRRTDVKDAHDRFANIEISYLLERMERFKGLAILATNRRKDLDEAFMRRLRYVIEFPLPGVAERERIWRLVFPLGIDVSEVDFPYLAKQFQFSGGHIRSIAFNACLQSAEAAGGSGSDPGSGTQRKLQMTSLLVAVKRELEKMNRAAGEELFGAYERVMRELVA